MAHFLRLLRRKLIPEGKLTRYVLYAVGEITLIVIGIGIAVNVSNYSEEKKALKQSNKFLEGMVEDLASDTLQLDRMLKQLEAQLANEQWLIDKRSFNVDDIDSIKLAASSIKWTFRINDRSFQNIQSSNGSKLFGYDLLYTNISKYYLVMGNRIEQNNELEYLHTVKADPFQHLISNNLLLETREYQDYTGFAVSIKDVKNTNITENKNEVITHLTDIDIQNSIKDKFSRHNYLFLSLMICNVDAKALLKHINHTMQLNSQD